MKPTIGVVPRYKRLETGVAVVYISESTRRSLQKAGANVNLIMPVQDIDNIDYRTADFEEFSIEEKEEIDSILDNCDALLIPGGSKSTPYDRYLLEQAIIKKMPVLGICLGMQVMSFYKEDIELNDINSNINHYPNNEINQIAHKVKISKDSKLFNLIDEEVIDVNSYHRKCITNNGIYSNVAVSDDGVIEAIELPGDVFNVGVQWHPEINYDFDINSRIIINGFVDEAKIYKNSKNKETLTMK